MPTSVLRRAPGSPKLSHATVKRLGNVMLEALGRPDAELSVLLTDDAQIQELNLQHRGKDKPTDVLAFPQETPEASLQLSDDFAVVLGDIVISLDTAEKQARGRRRDLEDEVRLLLAHGLLHLVGYDHAEPEEARLMRKETRRLVAAAKKNGLERPGGDKPRVAARKPRRTPRKHR